MSNTKSTSTSNMALICEHSTKVQLHKLYCVCCRCKHSQQRFIVAFSLTNFGAELASQLTKRPVEKGYCCSKYYQRIYRKLIAQQKEEKVSDVNADKSDDDDESDDSDDDGENVSRERDEQEPPFKIAKIEQVVSQENVVVNGVGSSSTTSSSNINTSSSIASTISTTISTTTRNMTENHHFELSTSPPSPVEENLSEFIREITT